MFFKVACAQLPDYHLQLFDYASGILPNEIIGLTRDNEKMLWILYENQIQRFDGKEMQNFKLPGQMRSILCDDAGNIWVSSRTAVYKLSWVGGTFLEVYIDKAAEKRSIGPLLLLNDKRIWLMVSNGFYQYNAGKEMFEPTDGFKINFEDLEANNCAIIDDHIFVNNSKCFYRIKVAGAQVDSIPISNVDFYGLWALSTDSVLISAKQAPFVRWGNFASKKITEGEIDHVDDHFFSVRSAAAISESKFLVAASNGLLEYNKSTRRFNKLRFFLNGRDFSTNEFATHIYCDSDGYVWLATTEGIAKFSATRQLMGLMKIRQLNNELSVNIDNVRQMIRDNDDNLWFATGYGFVSWQKDKANWQYFPPSESTEKLSHESVRGLAYDGKYLILGPTNKGVWLFDTKTHQYKRPNYESPEIKTLIERDFINYITPLKNGNFIVCARNAAYLLTGKTYLLTKINTLPADRGTTNFALENKDGIIWFGTEKGVMCLDASLNFLSRSVLEKNQSNFVTTGHILADDSFLFSYTRGLFVANYQNSEIGIHKKTSAFDNVKISILYEDSGNVIWAGSENGIYRYDPSNSKINLFDRSDNIQGYGFNSLCWLRDANGIIYYGGLNGINYWHPETLYSPSQSFEAYITKAAVNNKPYSMYVFNNIQPVQYSGNSISASFGSVYFNNPEKIRYRYKLEGLDTAWKDIGNGNNILLSSLAPGKYSLQMQASINQVEWKSAKNSLVFTILKPFWMTWWFIGICLTALVAVVWMMIRNRNKKIADQKEELETQKAINYFSNRIYESNSIQDILSDVVENCIARLHFEDCIIYKMDKENAILIPQAAYNPRMRISFDKNPPKTIAVGKGITGHVAITGEAEIIDDTNKDPRYLIEWEKKNSEITVPIIADGTVWGIIDCEHSRKGFFKQKHLSILTTIASLCANKIIKVKAEEDRAEAQRLLIDTQQKMAEAEMLALRAQMNPHFIFNSLNSINRYIVKSDQVTASLYLTRFAKLIRMILDNSNSKSITLSSELEALSLYMEMESIRFEKKFTYHISVESEINTESTFVPPLIIQPYVENAIWHGLLHKETAGTLTIRLTRKSPEMLQCTIEDDGVGREKAKELRSKSGSGKKSLGMKLTESRLDLLSVEMNGDASVEIEDLVDAWGNGTGTRVILNIPIEKFVAEDFE